MTDTFRHSIRGTVYRFENLRMLLAKACPARSGGELAGLAARDATERIAARMALVDLPLSTFLSEAIVVSDNLRSVERLLRLMDNFRIRYGAVIQSCVLAHVSTQIEAIRQRFPIDLVFQSIAGTEAANRPFGVPLSMLREAHRALEAGLAKADWSIAPIIIVEQARVAISDEIGYRIGARQSLVLIGERPGMSSPDSLGAYLSWDPHRRVSDALRNCVSNIREGGLSYEEAAHKIAFLLVEARTRKLSGVSLKGRRAAVAGSIDQGFAIN